MEVHQLNLSFEAVDKSNFNLLEELFTKKGACGGCWCMNWRLSAADFEKNKGNLNRKLLQEMAVNQVSPIGIVAILNKKAVGWCSVGPRDQFVRLKSSRLFRPEKTEKMIWSITCLYVHPDSRGRGISVQLVRAAIDFAIRNGADDIEAYPYDTGNKKTAAPFIWTGTPSVFKKAGMRCLKKVSETRSLYRLQGRKQ